MPESVASPESLSFVYDGALASRGQLHFYEYGRAAYAVARLVSTIEHFRRTGTVASRITRTSYVDVIIRAPERGSFPIDILIPTIETAKHVSELSGIPIGVFLKYVVNLVSGILPKHENTVMELAKLALQNSKQETQRVKEIRKMVESGNATTRTALEVITQMIDSDDPRIARRGISQGDIIEANRALQEKHRREIAFHPYERSFEAIEQDKLVKLARKVRPQIAEAGIPLRRSANTMQISQGNTRDVFATFDKPALENIAGMSLDRDTTLVAMRFIAYDRDHGFGKCDIADQDLHRVSFSVPINLRKALKKRILAGLDKDVEQTSVRYFRNRDGAVSSVLIDDIIPV